MQFLKLKPVEISPNPKEQKPILQQPFINLNKHFSGFIQHVFDSIQPQPSTFSNPNTSSPKTHLELALENLGNQAKRVFLTGISHFAPSPNPASSSTKNAIWARISSPNETQFKPIERFNRGMPIEAIEERLAGVPVYALSNSAEEFVLVSGVKSGKSLGLFCFKREDAEALLDQMKSMEPSMRGSKVVAVALNKVFQLKVDGVAFRLIPESCQIMNALKTKETLGDSDQGFSGVPVFQSQSLVLRSQNKRYRPFFFRKEDLEMSLFRASQLQKTLDPAFKKGDIQVCVLEEIIQGMKESSTSKWDDVVFIPPGFDVSTVPSQQRLSD
ncbi:tic22-like family protein [Tasmannia lanceolata]|uniref:tic22-like family protein n=1 Tax=Tasmannia lanceolata TaxID=3420 RepID=UPI0040640A69